MKTEIIQGFKAKINDVIFTDEIIYYSIKYILEEIEAKFGECYNEDFVQDLYSTIEIMEQKYEMFSHDILTSDFYNCIEKANNFNEIKFEYDGDDWKIRDLNKKIKNRDYLEK
jgi:putative pathogenicity island protein